MLVAVGGHTRNIGKTSVVCGIIRGLAGMHWTAVKITQYGHGVCTHGGHGCDCGPDLNHPYALDEELEPNRSDSGRFLAAGARRSFWLRTPAGGLGPALPVLRKILAAGEHTIVESNSLIEHVAPDLYLAVLDFAQSDFKESSRRFLDRADALVVLGSARGRPAWSGIAPELWSGKPQFAVTPPDYSSGALLQFVRERL